MSSFNDLPQELIIKIVDAAVEDAVILKAESLRRSILIALALVSKAFVLPSQKALWRFMDEKDLNKIQDLIVQGLAKDKIVLELECNFYHSLNVLSKDGPYRPGFYAFLNSIAELWDLNVAVITMPGLGMDHLSTLIDLSSFPSIKNVRKLKARESVELVLPPQLPRLRNLVFDSSNHFIETSPGFRTFQALKGSIITLSTLTFVNLSLEPLVEEIIIPFLREIGPNLKSLSFDCCDREAIEAFLPLCPKLTYLHLDHDEDYSSGLDEYLKLLPPSVQLNKLFYRAQDASLSIFTPSLFLIPAIRSIQYIYIQRYASWFDPDSGTGREEKLLFEELCASKGIIGYIRTELDVEFEREVMKQKRYRNKQKKLDSLRDEVRGLTI